MSDLTRGEAIELLGVFFLAVVAIAVYLLQQRISDKQKVERRVDLEGIIGRKLNSIRNSGENSKIQLYNSKLIGNKNFAKNKRSRLWGYPFHGAELYDLTFDGVEFVVSIEKRNKDKYYKVGLIPYERILYVRLGGDGSFNGVILYVEPKLVQKDKYSIAYSTFRYYLIKPPKVQK